MSIHMAHRYGTLFFISVCAGSSVAAFSSCCEQGLLFIVVHRLLIEGVSSVEHRLWGAQAPVVVPCGSCSCSSRVLECGDQ